MNARQVGTKLRSDEDLPPGRRRLAHVLVALYGHLNEPTLERAAQRLENCGYKKDPSEISRYLNGRRVPPANFVRVLHKAAVEQAGLSAVGMTRDQLLSVHAGAEPTLCRSCPELRRRNRTLQGELKGLLDAKAGLETALAGAEERLAHLPVPLPNADRQVWAKEVAAARQVAKRAEELHLQGEHEGALALLRETSEVLTPIESAATLVLLHQREQSQLAETLIQIYGRDQPRKAVMRVALELHDCGMTDAAGAILRAAVG
ncbi:hypothetical protein AB0K71_30130 [Streptomyces syringium]|uniref:hypothetical protein n=1 Tax=Streptomyces syringium TaxID=76729 RepID=UPI003448B8BB